MAQLGSVPQVIIWVGYMRRYATAFVEAVKIVHSMKKIEYARVRDIIGYVRFLPIL
jgi:cytochrome c1